MRTSMLGLMAVTIAAGTCFGQADPLKFYKLDFVVKEVEGTKVLNSRSYSMIVPAVLPGQQNTQEGGGSIRTTSRVPLSNNGLSANSYNYGDIGVNIDCRALHEIQPSDLSVYITADINSTSNEPNLPAPVTRSNRWSSLVIVPLKKPTVVYASDDATSKRQLQLELTATPVH